MELSENIPCELMEEIIRRLPVKSIKRFQGVSKSWCLLINKKLFVKSQLEWSLATNSCCHLIMTDQKVFSMDLDGPGKIQVIEPPFCLPSFPKISDSCNGLVLVESEPPILWNPFTRDHKILSGYTAYNPNTKVFYGFAYDSINEDYKVVRVVGNRIILRTEIYSLKSSTWKQIENFNYCLSFPCAWCFQINGALHTIVKHKREQAKIMAFSVETEKHYEIELLSCMDGDMNLDTVGGCLSVISKNEDQIAIWVMKDYGMTKSWTKMISLRVPNHIDSIDRVKPLVYSKDGHKVMLIYNYEEYWSNRKDTKLVWFDLRKETTEDVHAEVPNLFRAQVCVNSLVSLKTSEDIDDQRYSLVNFEK